VFAGPLVAAIDAQASAAFTTLSFIQSVGFLPDGSVVNQRFDYNVTNTTDVSAITFNSNIACAVGAAAGQPSGTGPCRQCPSLLLSG
jgi:hypothetical protein